MLLNFIKGEKAAVPLYSVENGEVFKFPNGNYFIATSKYEKGTIDNTLRVCVQCETGLLCSFENVKPVYPVRSELQVYGD